MATLPVMSSSAIEYAPPKITLDDVQPLRIEPVANVEANDAKSISAALRDSLAANDLPRFELALKAARRIADAMPLGNDRNALRRLILVYSDIGTVKSFAANDRLGAFYDEDALPGLHDRLAADYPGYAAFIAENQIVDRNGRTFYPTAETVAFLLGRVEEPRRAEPVKIAETKTTGAPAGSRRYTKANTTPVPMASAVVPQPTPITTDALANDIRKAAKPVVSAVAPVVAAAVVVPQQSLRGTASANAVVPVPAEDSPGGAVIFLLVVGLIAVGVVTMFVRMPGEAPQPKLTILPPLSLPDQPTVVTRPSSERIA